MPRALEAVQTARQISELRWRDATDHNPDMAGPASECLGWYDLAEQAVREGDWAICGEALEQARRLEADAGDDQDARGALLALAQAEGAE